MHMTHTELFRRQLDCVRTEESPFAAVSNQINHFNFRLSKIFTVIKMRAALIALVGLFTTATSQMNYAMYPAEVFKGVSNQCVQFSVSGGTGCAWMCNYCAGALGTNNYYFTDGVCTYQEGTGCVGNPIAGKTYTCCAAS